jgi:hypothetical protein
MTLLIVSFFALAVFFGLYATNASVVFAVKYTCTKYDVQLECCAVINGKKWCTLCDVTQPPSNCLPRYPGRTAGETAPPTNVAPPKVCPDGSSPDANGVCPPVTQGTPSPPPPKSATGTIEQPPTNLAPPQPPSTSQTTTCPDGSSPDANGQCPPTMTTGNQNPQSLTNNNNNNGGGSHGDNNNNIQSQQQNNKGSNLLGHAGELTGKKKGSSPTPPPCPTDNSPIPPNCTLKPKF